MVDGTNEYSYGLNYKINGIRTCVSTVETRYSTDLRETEGL